MYAAATIVFIGLAAISGYFGFKIPEGIQRSTPIWLNGGIYLALYYVWGTRAIPTIVVASLITNVGFAGRPLWISLLLACSSIIGVHFASMFMKPLYKTKQDDETYDFSEAARLTVAALIMPLLNSVTGTTYVAVTNHIPASEIISVFTKWWLGFFLGILLVTPLFLTWWRDRTTSVRALLKFAGVILLTSPILYVIFFTPREDGFLFVIFPILIGTAWVLPRNLFLTFVLLLNITAIVATSMGFGPFRAGSFGGNITNLQIFLGTVSITAVTMEGFRQNTSLRAPIIALLCGWLLSGTIYYLFSEGQNMKDAQQAKVLATDLEYEITERLNVYVNNLQLVAHFLENTKQVEHEKWLLYFNSVNATQRYPGIGSVGAIYKESREWMDLKPPLTTDLNFSASSATPILTTNFTALMNQGDRDKIALYIPFYEGQTPSGRDAAHLAGFIFSPVNFEHFFDSVVNQTSQQMALTVFAGTKAAGIPIFVSDAVPIQPERGFDFISTIHLAHFPITIGWQRSESFVSSRDLSGVILSSTASLLTLLLASIFVNLQLVGQRAERIAREKSKELEKQRMVATHSAKMASLGEMAGGIAHEINNPLGIIRGTSQMLQRTYRNNKSSEVRTLKGLKAIEDTSMRISKIIKGLHTISRSGENDPFLPEDLHGIVEQTLGLCRARFTAAQIRLIVDPTPHVTIACRATQISQVILNLLSNSYDAVISLPERWVKISFEFRQNRIGLIVTDSGNRIPEDIREKVFQPFYTSKEAGHGTGLGLSISMSIAETHHGRLYLDEAAPHTSFVLELPLS